MMLVKILGFGSNWWARFGRDPQDRYRYTRHAAYFNSAGVRCGNKMRRHWVVPGLLRFNGLGDFNPQFPNRAVGKTFECADLIFALGGNRVLFTRRVAHSAPRLLPVGCFQRQVRGLRLRGFGLEIPIGDADRREPFARKAGGNAAHESRRLGPQRARCLAAESVYRSPPRGGAGTVRRRRFRAEGFGLCDTPKAAWSSTAERDIPLLRQVRNSRFVSHQQLFDFMKFGGFDRCRSSFNWRAKRLVDYRQPFDLRGVFGAGSCVYRIRREGLALLEHHGQFTTVLHSNTAHLPHLSQAFHSLELNAIQLGLRARTCLPDGNRRSKWHRLIPFRGRPIEKDYDAIVDVWVGDKRAHFALEYERTLKSVQAI